MSSKLDSIIGVQRHLPRDTYNSPAYEIGDITGKSVTLTMTERAISDFRSDALDKAMQRLFQERGGQFAPDVVDALIEVQHAFADIAQRFADTETDLQRQIDYLAKAIAESP